jgi:hypothetical protein
LPALVSEEKVIFGLNAKAVSQLTLAKIRKVYSRADNKAIAKQLGMSSHENATPIRILHNSAGHLGGPARSLGGVVIGYLGVRVFSPRPVAKMIENVGGCSVLLGEISSSEFYTLIIIIIIFVDFVNPFYRVWWLHPVPLSILYPESG